MTRSSRRANAIAGRTRWKPSNECCIECKGPLVLTRGITYICTRCGLIQDREKEQDLGDHDTT
nr:hypothetical protein [Candidatus Sigynarchaeota archaeon]